MTRIDWPVVGAVVVGAVAAVASAVVLVRVLGG